MDSPTSHPWALLLCLVTLGALASSTPKTERREVESTKRENGPRGLQWATLEQWDEMPGGRIGNPLVKQWGYRGSGLSGDGYCKYFIQTEHNGCWQTGCFWVTRDGDSEFINKTYDLDLKRRTFIANDGWDCCRRKDRRENLDFRVLVNPGNSVVYTWLEWDSGKETFPTNAVYGDNSEECKLLVATYYDSNSKYARGYKQGAQVDKDGYVYYGYDSGALGNCPSCDFLGILTLSRIITSNEEGRTWKWDNNEYKLLLEKGIKAYELIDIKFDFPKASKRAHKTISKKTIINDGEVEVERQTVISVRVTETSKWDHAISWNAGYSSSATVTLGSEAIGTKAEATVGYSIDVGGNHGWGGSSSTEVTHTETITRILPGKSGSEVTMTAITSRQTVPYEAQVRITYDDGTSRVVTDKGKWEGVVVSNFDTNVGDIYKL